MTPNEIKQAVHDALNERDGLDRDTHRAHHRYIQSLCDRQAARRESWERVRTTVIGGLILGAIGGFLSLLAWVDNLWVKSGTHH